MVGHRWRIDVKKLLRLVPSSNLRYKEQTDGTAATTMRFLCLLVQSATTCTEGKAITVPAIQSAISLYK